MCPDIEPAPAERILPLDVMPDWAGLIPLRKAEKSLWARLRKAHFAEHPPVCEICRAAHETHCIDAHEVCSFADPACIWLERIAFICYCCHRAIHFERTTRFAQPAHLQEIVAHYCQVNGGISAQDFEQDRVDARSRSREIHHFYKGPRPSVPPPQKSCKRLVKDSLWEEFMASAREWGTAPPIHYGPFEEAVETSRQCRQRRRQAPATQMRVIRTFLGRYARQFYEARAGVEDFHPDYADNIEEAAAVDAAFREKLADHLQREDYQAARSSIGEFLDEHFDDDRENLPDHEAPWATAMWRDSFA